MDIPETHQDLKTSQCRVCQLLATIKQAEYDDSACTLLRFCARPVLRDHVEGIEVPQFSQNDGQVLGCGFDNNSTFTWFRKAGFIGITHSTRHAEFGMRRIDLNSADFDLVKGPLYQGLELLIAKASFLRLSQLHINCIDQNNEAHRSQQIACMGDIYANAELAIIAASKNHADYRLPGVDSTARQDQPQVQIGPVKLLEGHRHPSHELLDTPWSTRGWTLQESILSRRRMIFSDTEVTFLCNTIHWAESWLSPGLDADFRANLKFRGLIPLAHNDKAHGLTIRYIDAVALGTVDVPQVPLPVDDDVPDTETLISKGQRFLHITGPVLDLQVVYRSFTTQQRLRPTSLELSTDKTTRTATIPRPRDGLFVALRLSDTVQMLIAVDMDEEEFVPPVIGVVLYSCAPFRRPSRVRDDGFPAAWADAPGAVRVSPDYAFDELIVTACATVGHNLQLVPSSSLPLTARWSTVQKAILGQHPVWSLLNTPRMELNTHVHVAILYQDRRGAILAQPVVAAALPSYGHLRAHSRERRMANPNTLHPALTPASNKTAPFEEISTPNTNVNTRLFNDPTYATDIRASTRCGRDNMAHAADTEVLTIRAGDTVEFAHQRYEPAAWTDAMWDNCPDGRGSCNPARADGVMDINHEGPVIAHLSQVPEGLDVTAYDGSGEWVKIFTLGMEWRADQTEPIHWLAYNKQGSGQGWPGRFMFKIPAQTPAGQYLLRMDEINTGLEEHNEAFNSSSPAQLYPSCAQIQVESDYSGDLPRGIPIPESFSHTSPGMAITLNMYRDKKIDEGYVYPGGPLWDGTTLVQDKPAA
ncbi:hypothetical protein JX266_005508 [Neoarthrinium moseri]|nr:hypothetical protein JX266_005508 [Neoarthrinium moseri]